MPDIRWLGTMVGGGAAVDERLVKSFQKVNSNPWSFGYGHPAPLEALNAARSIAVRLARTTDGTSGGSQPTVGPQWARQ